MKLLKILKWAFLFVLLAAVTAGAAGIWAWTHRNQFIQQQLLARFEQVAPELSLHLDDVQILSPSVVRLDGVSVRDADEERPLFRCQQILLVLDETELLQRQRVVVRSVEIRNPDILATRAPSGRWNWQDYRFYPPDVVGPVILPDVVCTDVRLQINLEHGVGIPSASLLLTSPQIQAIPASSANYDFAGVISLPGAGNLSLTGGSDLSTGKWQLTGRMAGVKADSQLADIAKSAHPELSDRLQDIDNLFERILPPTQVTTAPASGGLLIGTTATAPRFVGELDLDFSIQSAGGGAVPEFRLMLHVREGRVSSPKTPLQLTDVEASFFWDNENVVGEISHGVIDGATVTGAMRMHLARNPEPATAELHIRDLLVDARLKPLCPPPTQRLFENFLPKGILTLDAEFRQTDSGTWKPFSLIADVRESSIRFHRFNYLLDNITATFRQRAVPLDELATADTVVDVDMTGTAGSRPVAGKGVLRNPGPEVEVLFEIGVTGMPIDEQFRAALDENGKRVLDALNITGVTNATARCYRPPGRNQTSDMLLKADVFDAKMRFSGFPWDITDLSGALEYDSRTKDWSFENLTGRHGAARLTGSGMYRGTPQPGTLKLNVITRDAPLDSDLYHALTASQQELWQLLNPDGTVHLTTQITWTAAPGQAAVVKLPRVELVNTHVYPTPFPYHMTIQSAHLSYDPNDPRFAGVQHCEIHSLQADHSGVSLSATGWAELTADNFWQLHFNDMKSGQLNPDGELRAALPASWRYALTMLSQEGKVSIDSSQIDFRGRAIGETPPTAAWDMKLKLQNCRIYAGLELENVSGTVLAKGHWDGYELQNQGHIDLERLEFLEMPITRISGPYVIDNYELLLGNRAVFTESDPLSVSPKSRIQARAYGGMLYADGIVELGSKQSFRMFTNVDDALLERYAAMHIPDEPDVKGVVNAWLYLKGEGEDVDSVQGRGQLEISPATLYELPVMVQVLAGLSKLNFAVPNKTAFHSALLTFDVHDRSFWFNPIDLVGESLALRGRGQVGFGGDVVLDFFSRPPRPRRPTIPLANLLLSGATQWVGVQVRGTTERPQTMVRSTIKIDESMKQFLSAFQPGQGGPAPGLVVPGIFTLPRFPQAMLPRGQPPAGRTSRP
jgi:hypothetical protein